MVTFRIIAPLILPSPRPPFFALRKESGIDYHFHGFVLCAGALRAGDLLVADSYIHIVEAHLHPAGLQSEFFQEIPRQDAVVFPDTVVRDRPKAPAPAFLQSAENLFSHNAHRLPADRFRKAVPGIQKSVHLQFLFPLEKHGPAKHLLRVQPVLKPSEQKEKEASHAEQTRQAGYEFSVSRQHPDQEEHPSAHSEGIDHKPFQQLQKHSQVPHGKGNTEHSRRPCQDTGSQPETRRPDPQERQQEAESPRRGSRRQPAGRRRPQRPSVYQEKKVQVHNKIEKEQTVNVQLITHRHHPFHIYYKGIPFRNLSNEVPDLKKFSTK